MLGQYKVELTRSIAQQMSGIEMFEYICFIQDRAYIHNIKLEVSPDYNRDTDSLWWYCTCGLIESFNQFDREITAYLRVLGFNENSERTKPAE